MKNFIEVTEGKRKTLIAVNEIKTIIQTRKGKAVIYLKQRYFSWIVPFDNEICAEETYEEICAKLLGAAE